MQSDTQFFRPVPCTSPEGSSAHLVGICGTGMKALAEVLTGFGWRVTGSDLQVSPTSTAMQRRGFRVHQGHHEHFLPQNTDVVIHSPAIRPENPELEHARQLGIPVFSYSQMLGELMKGRLGISVAGTHGKSTTSAMVATILRECGRSPSAIVGAEFQDTNSNGWAGEGDVIVVESCEYQQSFLDLNPTLAVVLNIELDHFDCYSGIDELVAAFREFVGRISPDGKLFVRADDPHAKDLISVSPVPYETFSFVEGSDWWAGDIRPIAGGSRFRVFHESTFFGEFTLQVPGRHNVMNALAATAISHAAGVSARSIREGLQEFSGLKRRFERVGSWRGVTIIDDYAHHPTAVQMTLATARKEFGQRRLLVAFQPHQVSRTDALMDEFAESFCVADRVFIVPVFAARESNNSEACRASRELADRIREFNTFVEYVPSLDRLARTIEDAAQPGDVLITMGAGEIDRVHHEFDRRFQRHYSSR
ncbi:MAG: UDP-N-acetylmuramate--L-alanine ligase [Planctomycetota bacterium]|nr:UDP-N-acetylmuramate--L-alanine ligase [Planctomycetota bacterium]